MTRPLSSRPLERDVERYLSAQVRRRNGESIKLSGSSAGLPDRLVLLNGRAHFVEVKRPGEKPRPLQEHWLRILRQRGFEAEWVDSIQAVDRLLARWTEDGV